MRENSFSKFLKPAAPSESTTRGDKGVAGVLPYAASEVVMLHGCDLKPEAINWIWPGWLAAGKLHILGGAPSTGKTTIGMSFAATVTKGGNWPDGTYSPQGNVVIWSGEDDPADTLVPRLILSGADLNHVYFVGDVTDSTGKRAFDPARDMKPLADKLAEIGNVRLLIVDPIVSAIAGDSHKNAEVRRGLQPLVDLAGLMRCALVGVTHFSKGTGGREPVERITGSLAFGALARVVLVAARHQEEDEGGNTKRVLLRAKSNIGPDDGGFEYELQQGELDGHHGIVTSAVRWGSPVEGAARELLATADATGDDGEGGEPVSSVVQWLDDLLTDEGGKLDRRDVMKAAMAMGFKERTVHRAREKLGVIVNRSGFGKDKRSVWCKPENSINAKHAIDANKKELADMADMQASGTYDAANDYQIAKDGGA
ncbi:MAG: AAA family ATPase [Thiobacillus sp.]